MKFLATFALAALVLSTIWVPMPAAGRQSDDELAKRARALHASALVFDAHIDTTLRLTRTDWDFTREHQPVPAGTSSHPESQSQLGHADLPRIRKGGLDALFFGVVVRHPSDSALTGPITGPRAVHDALVQVAAVHKLAEDLPNEVVFCTKADEVRRAHQQGRIAALIGVEGGHMINNSLPILRMFAKLGVRYMTLTHFHHTDWADSSGEPPRHNGLTEFGRQVVREMNRLGMLVDISHVSDKTFQDALEVSQAPMIASHSSARAIAGHVRNMSDVMIKALAAKGGVIAINFHVPYLDQTRNDYQTRIQPLVTRLIAQYPGEEHESRRQAEVARQLGPPPAVSWEKIVDHIDRIVRLAGVDHVALGSDFDGAAMPEGMEDVSRLPRITEALLRKGYSESDIRKILGENLLRVMAEAERIVKRPAPPIRAEADGSSQGRAMGRAPSHVVRPIGMRRRIVEKGIPTAPALACFALVEGTRAISSGQVTFSESSVRTTLIGPGRRPVRSSGTDTVGACNGMRARVASQALRIVVGGRSRILPRGQLLLDGRSKRRQVPQRVQIVDLPEHIIGKSHA
jgi:membrane dipeptidase